MSDQQRVGAIISLEEVFLSRDFGRRSPRPNASTAATVDPSDPPQLEQVFLSEWFGHPEAIAAEHASATATTPAVAQPTLVLLAGRGTEHDAARYRAIGAVSGVAAAALVVAGVVSTGQPSGQPTISAQGPPPGHSSPAPGTVPLPGPGGVTTQPSTSTGTPSPPPTAGSGAATVVQLASTTTPAIPAVVVEVPPPTPVAPSTPPPSGTTPPPAPAPGGGGNILKPVLSVVGNTVSTVGTTVTSASNDLAQALPPASPVTGLLGNVGSMVTSLGQSVADA